MGNQTPLDGAYGQFRALPPHKTLLVLHPAAYQYHRTICYELLETVGGTYINLPATPITLDGMISLIAERLQDTQAETLPQLNGDPARQLAEVINQHPQFLLVIDGYEWVDTPEVHDFIFRLAQQLQPERRLLLKGQGFPLELLGLEGIREMAAILPVDDDELLVDHTQYEPDKIVLEVRSLGPGQAYVNGRKLAHWEGLLPKCLFFFMVDRGMTSREDIFNTFWRDLKKREATNVFHVTKRKISELLGVDLTTYSSSFYRIADNIVLHYDVITFLEAAQNAAVEEDEAAIRLYEKAIRLYRGAFLNTLDMEWVTHRREELHMTYTDALAGLARIYQKQGRYAEALGLFLRASANIPPREDLVRDVMALYAETGALLEAIQAYERLEKVLKDTLNVAPSPETQQLAEDIRRQIK